MKAIHDFLAGLAAGPAQTCGDLSLIPLLAEKWGPTSYLTLEQGIESGAAEVTETSESGTVPELLVRNRGESDMLIADGELLVGSKQNRIVNVTIVVAAHSELIIPVSCVEQGRWSYRSRHFSSGESFAYASLRRDKFAHVRDSMRRYGGARTDQSRIWDDIASKSARMGVHSATGSMDEMTRPGSRIRPHWTRRSTRMSGRWEPCFSSGAVLPAGTRLPAATSGGASSVSSCAAITWMHWIGGPSCFRSCQASTS